MHIKHVNIKLLSHTYLQTEFLAESEKDLFGTFCVGIETHNDNRIVFCHEHQTIHNVVCI